MDYEAVLDQVLALLRQRETPVLSRPEATLQLDDETLEALKEDLIYAKRLAVDEDGRVLVWTGDRGDYAHWFRINPGYQATRQHRRPRPASGLATTRAS